MEQSAADISVPRSYEERIDEIQVLIAEADACLRSDAERLREIAAQIESCSTAVGYRRGSGYVEFYRGVALYLQAKFEDALPFFARAHDIFTDTQDMGGVGLALRYMGLSHHLLCRYEWALEYYRQELAVREQFFASDCVSIAGTLTNIATMHLLMGCYDTALQRYMEALRQLEGYQDDRVYPATLSNIGNVYMALGQYTQALEYQHHVLSLYQQAHDDIGEANTLLNMGWTYNHCAEYAEALECSNRALKFFEEQGNRKKAAIAMLYLGQTCMKLGQTGEALSFLGESFRISSEIGDRKNCADVLRASGDMAAAEGDYDKATEYYLDALEIVQEIGLRQIEYELYELLAQMQEHTKNPTAALEYYRHYMRVKEEVLDERRRQAVAELQLRFDVEHTRKEREIYRLRSVELAGVLEELEALNRELIAVNNEKNDLMGIVAHDLKNPISGLCMAISLLKNYLPQMSPEKILHHIDLMNNTVLRMDNIVAKLLDVNALDSGSMTFHREEFDLNEVVQTVLNDFAIRTSEKNIAVHRALAHGPLPVSADRGATLEVLDNIMSNAVKYSPRHSSIEVRSSVVGAMVRFEVRDSGPGISEEDRGKLFKKFSRLSAKPTGGESSTGLGLSIVKKLVEGMQGRVWCESTPGEGATFLVELPMAGA